MSNDERPEIVRCKECTQLHSVNEVCHKCAPLEEAPKVAPHELMKYFEYGHLPPHLQQVSAPVCEVAKVYDKHLAPSAEKDAGLRKLLEAKDCLVRAALP